MAGTFELLPVATSTSHPDLNIATGLPKTGAITALNKTTIPSVIENRVFPVLDHAARLLTFMKDAYAAQTIKARPPSSPTSLMTRSRTTPGSTLVGRNGGEWRSFITKTPAILRSAQASCGRALGIEARLSSGNDAISGSFLFSYMSSEVMSFDILKEMCMPTTLATRVRHVLLQTDDHVVLVLFNKDHTIATFSHIEALDLNQAPIASIDVLAPPPPSPCRFTMVAQAMVDCRDSVASGEVATTSTTFPGSAGSVSMLRFPLRNLTATLPTVPIAETNLLGFALTCELRKGGIESKEEIFDAGGEVDAAGENEEKYLAEVGVQVVDEPVLAAAPDLFETLMMDHQMIFESNEAQQLAAMLAMAPVRLENQSPIAITEEILESIANPAAMTPASTIPSMWPPIEQPILDPVYFPILPSPLSDDASLFPYPNPADGTQNDFTDHPHNPVDVTLYDDLAHYQDQPLTQASGSSHGTSLNAYQGEWDGDDN
ncbi:hypothetical protein FRB97_009729, partial [Tulasnella sp. 331]